MGIGGVTDHRVCLCSSSSWHQVSLCIRDAQNPGEALQVMELWVMWSWPNPSTRHPKHPHCFLIYWGAFAHPYFAQAVCWSVVSLHSRLWFVMDSLLGLDSAPAGSGSISMVPGAWGELGEQSLTPCVSPCLAVSAGSSWAPLGRASQAIPSGICIWHRALLKTGREMEQWDAAAGGEQPGKEEACTECTN